MCVGDPPERGILTVSMSQSPEPLSPTELALAELARDVHSMDIKTQAALQRYRAKEIILKLIFLFSLSLLCRIRDLGSLLAGGGKGMVEL